jgi:hypothetical protein
VDTTFPGETTTDYVHDGLMKRRLRAVDPAGAYVFTWWRYDSGWNALAEYAGSGTVLGARQKSYVYQGMTPLAEIASANLAPAQRPTYRNASLTRPPARASISLAC